MSPLMGFLGRIQKAYVTPFLFLVEYWACLHEGAERVADRVAFHRTSLLLCWQRMDPDSIAPSFVYLHNQDLTAFTFELDLRFVQFLSALRSRSNDLSLSLR